MLQIASPCAMALNGEDNRRPAHGRMWSSPFRHAPYIQHASAARVRTERKRRACEPFRGEGARPEHRRRSAEERSCYSEVVRSAAAKRPDATCFRYWKEILIRNFPGPKGGPGAPRATC